MRWLAYIVASPYSSRYSPYVRGEVYSYVICSINSYVTSKVSSYVDS